MLDGLIKSQEEVRGDEQDMIRTCEQHGITRKTLAALFNVDVSYFGHLMSDASTWTASARIHDGLESICSHLGQFQHVERHLPENAYVTTSESGKTNGCFIDEIREAAEITGRVSEDEKRRDHRRLRDWFRRLQAVAVRGEQEAVLKLKAISNGH